MNYELRAKHPNIKIPARRQAPNRDGAGQANVK
jgi:hypothetical protein